MSCAAPAHPGATGAEPPRPTLRIVAMTDIEGMLEPCGCQSRPLGGLDRAAALVAELRADGVPTILVVAGDTFVRPGAEPASASAPANPTALPAGSGAPASATPEPVATGDSPPPAPDGAADPTEDWRAETLARALREMGLVGAALGTGDLTWTARASSGGKRPPGTGVGGEPLLISEFGVRVGLFALDAGDAQKQILAAETAAAELRDGGADVVIGLYTGPASTAHRIAGPGGTDFLLVGGLSESTVRPPDQAGDTTLLHAGRHGHGLLVLDLVRRGHGLWTDASEWTRDRRRAHLDRRILNLETRISGWENEPSVDSHDLDEQRSNLARLRKERAAIDGASPGGGNLFYAHYLEIGQDRARDPDVAALLGAHARRVNARNREAFANVAPASAVEGQSHYVGADACRSCHETQFTWWRSDPHGTAYATLVRLDKQYHQECVGCHVTGYGRPGGAALVQNEGRIDVGCESCHGPGSAHVADEGAAGLVVRDAPAATCTACHDAEHSDLFEHAKYRARLIAPGHGQPAAVR
jgi:hypothetical protein